MSGRNPTAPKKTVAATKVPTTAPNARFGHKRSRGRPSCDRMMINSSVFTGATPIKRTQGLQSSVERHANRDLCHVQPLGRFANAGAAKRNGSDNLLLLTRQFPNQRVDIPWPKLRQLLLGLKRIHHIIDRHLDSSASPPKNVDNLVSCYRGQPGPNLSGGVPGALLQMDREQYLLHDILGLALQDTKSATTRASNGPNIRCYGMKELPVCTAVASHGRSHPRRPVCFPGRCGHLFTLTRRGSGLLPSSRLICCKGTANRQLPDGT